MDESEDKATGGNPNLGKKTRERRERKAMLMSMAS